MKRGRGQLIFRDFEAPLVHLVGDHLKGRVEGRSDKISQRHPLDHVWISMDPAISVRVMVSVNTFSLRHEETGFDPRVRLGVIRGTWETLPERGISECHRFSYDDLEGIGEVGFHPLERVFLEQTILDKVHQALLMEAWGTPYQREYPGIHQIHSRAASCAVPTAVEGRDGALKFYFREERRTELLLFKFCGQ
jgi:hypothetical protein